MGPTALREKKRMTQFSAASPSVLNLTIITDWYVLMLERILLIHLVMYIFSSFSRCPLTFEKLINNVLHFSESSIYEEFEYIYNQYIDSGAPIFMYMTG